MKELSINYNFSKTRKIIFLTIGGYLLLYGLFQCISLAIAADPIDVNFYLALVVAILGVLLMSNFTIWASKPTLILNSVSLYVHMISKKETYQSMWTNVREVSIGVSYLKMFETDGKEYNIDLSDFKYVDVKEIKSQVVEICESKNIPYKND